MTPQARSLLLKQITDKCGLPSDRLQPVGPAGLTINLQPTDQYQSVDCMLAELKKVRGIKLGFVGNEIYDENMQ